MILQAKCHGEAAMAGGLAGPDVFHRPKEKQTQADQKKAEFHHLTLLNVYQGLKTNAKSDPWCVENFIQPKLTKRAEDVRKQLAQIRESHNLRIPSYGRDTTRVRQTLCSGFFRNSARKYPAEGYKTLSMRAHPCTFILRLRYLAKRYATTQATVNRSGS
jgi:hypothetical protein